MHATVERPTPQAERRPAVAARTPPAAGAFAAELRTITGRIREPRTCRGALLEVLLRQCRLLGGAWMDGTPGRPALLVDRLSGPVLDRPDVRDWIVNCAAAVREAALPPIVMHPEIRNLAAVGVAIDGGTECREVVIVLAANLAATAGDVEVLSLQAVAAAWERVVLTRRATAAEDAAAAAAEIVDLTRRLDTAGSYRGAGQELVRSVQSHLSCGLVTLGMIRRGETLPRLVALSDGCEFDRHSPQMQRLEATLGESTLAARPMCCPDFTGEGAPQLAHKRLSETLGAEAVVSVPLRDADGTVLGSLLCVGTARCLLAESTTRFLHALALPAGAALASSRSQEGGALLRALRWSTSHAARWRGAGLLAATAALSAVLLIPASYRIPARCELAPVERRIAPAPFDGLLLDTLVAPGDVVAAGQPLAVMDGREIHWELAGVIADAERAAQERDTYRAAHDVARSYLSALEVERLQAREALLRDRLARLELRSPGSGIVLSGSLDRRENVPVTVGQPLYEVAPLDTLRLELAIPAQEISQVRSGMEVEVRLTGEAQQMLTGRIDRIRPASEIRDGLNVFIAEVPLPNPDGRWRPGMEGAARVIGDRHPLGWNLFHRSWEYVLQRVL